MSTQELIAASSVVNQSSAKPLRADARRNRDSLLAVAAVVFSERGTEASLEDIARQAGVGIGTLYRHFPTRDALIADVYRREVELLCGGAEQLLSTLPADEALAEWMRRFVSYVATKKGMATALKAIAGTDSQLFVTSRAMTNAAMTALIQAAIEQNLVRPDADPADVLRGMSGFCMMGDQPGWQDQALRLVGLLVDGLRFGAHST
jgi:AcrR family transcriptional regulator